MQNKDVGTVGYVIGSDGKTDLRERYQIKQVYRHINGSQLLLQALEPDGTPRENDTLKVPPAYFTAASALVEKPAVRSA
jgi:hypothetical protein